ncbi:MAG: hypothetical protein HC904_15505 [Blastochloris sp.]|nr:hypothetical protein [Blastochloris sp.]
METGKNKGGLAGVLALVFFIGVLPFLWQTNPLNDAEDHRSWHLPTVRAIAGHFPQLDLENDPKAAMTPGYHYLLAGLMVCGANETLLRGVHVALSLGLILVLGWRLSRVLSIQEVVFWLGPLIFSPYFLKASAWIVTDNPGLLGMTCTMLFLVSPLKKEHLVGLTLGITLSFWFRQTYLWLLVPMAYALWERGVTGRRWGSLFKMAGVGALPVLSAAWVFWEWQGLVPPVWREINQSLTLNSSIHALALAACIMGPGLWVFAKEGWLKFSPWWVASMLGGFCLAWSGPTTWSMEEGRWGGVLWNLTTMLPAWYERSLVFLFLVPVGAVVLTIWAEVLLRVAGVRGRIWCLSLACLILSWVSSKLAYQRYFEPPLFIFMILGFYWTMRQRGDRTMGSRVAWVMGLLMVVQILGLGWFWLRRMSGA